MNRILTSLFTLVFITLLGTQMSYGQLAQISGTVRSNGEIIPFASVALSQDSKIVYTTESDMDGKFIMSAIFAGTYDLQCQYVGLESFVMRNVKFDADTRLVMDIEMKEGMVMDEIVITDYSAPLITRDASTMGMTAIDAGSRTKHATPSGYPSHASTIIENDLPSAGQMTVGEWNDLHNWKDWSKLISDEEYAIMTHRHEIYPTHRYSVLVVNSNNEVIANQKVELVDEKNKVIWTAYSDNAGKAELWADAYAEGDEPTTIVVHHSKGKTTYKDLQKIEDGNNNIVVPVDCYATQALDIAFVVDATSSMNDEINYLKSELLDVMSRVEASTSGVDIQMASIFYRDKGDEYVTRVSPMSRDKASIIDFVNNQSSSGGGDIPEAVDDALADMLKLDWRDQAHKLAFLILDAGPHEDAETQARVKNQMKEAAGKGIKLIPVTASGIRREAEFLMKFMAILTNGTYVFITDHSGIGDAHLAPLVEDYEVEKLNDCLVRLITKYASPYSCVDLSDDIKSELDINIYPNPSTQYVNVAYNTKPDKLFLQSSNGMTVKTVTPNDEQTRIEVDDLISGVYTIVLVYKMEKITRQIIILR